MKPNDSMNEIPITNEQFAEMSPSEKRVAIAKDVIKHLDAKKFLALKGKFISSGYYDDGCRKPLLPKLNKENLSKEDFPHCECCAIGAAVMSGIRLFNTLDIEFVDDGSPLFTWFEPVQAMLIEIAFEMGSGYYDQYKLACGLYPDLDYRTTPKAKYDQINDHAAQLYSKARGFGWKFEESDDRMRAIFQNIIDNNGKFKP